MSLILKHQLILLRLLLLDPSEQILLESCADGALQAWSGRDPGHSPALDRWEARESRPFWLKVLGSAQSHSGLPKTTGQWGKGDTTPPYQQIGPVLVFTKIEGIGQNERGRENDQEKLRQNAWYQIFFSSLPFFLPPRSLLPSLPCSFPLFLPSREGLI